VPQRLIAGRYRLETKLGEGAMGIVWAAQDELLRRSVAVKEVRLPPGLPEDEVAELRERTLREARAIAVVTHPSVVTLYDVAQEDDVPFVVMELVPSQSLATILDKHGSLSDAQLALIVDSVAAALESAHRAGIVHRDVKPGNVLVGDDGRIKLSDFGISRNIAEDTLTRTGIMLGTPAYIAPEVASGDPVSPASDAWGLGATLFAAAEGHPPYNNDDDPLTTITSVVRDPVPEPTVTGPLGEVISGLMVKEPSKRMDLGQVRRRVQPMLANAGPRPFAMLLDPDAPTVRVRRPTATARKEEPAERGPAPLSDQPGPLPFTPREPARTPKRSLLGIVALGVVSVVLFAAAVVGGFVAVRTLAGAPLLPPPPAQRLPPPSGFQLVERTDRAVHQSSGGGGRFSIPAPAGWQLFHGQRDQSPAGSMAIHFVSPDGRSQLVVERFGGYFGDGHSINDYVRKLPELAAGSRGEFLAGTDRPIGAQDATSGESDRFLTYDTVEHSIVGSSQTNLRRNSTMQIMPRGGDMWLVRVTLPSTRSAEGQQLMRSIMPGFRTLP
jgi:tRNA A-37 threonylcarbamoyl transferase component Bud32